MNSDKFIRDTFLKLTSKTYPYGYEDDLVADMIKSGLFPCDIQKDKNDNYFYKIGESRTIFASHLDTVSAKHTKVNHVFDGKTIKTDGTTTLGADDKAGVTIMLWMMENNIPGLYYFFIGEEVGCVGSKAAASKNVFDFKGKYDRILSFDRRGTNSVITHQSYTRCCSASFADALASELNKGGVLSYIKDDGGIYTDSAEFTEIISECTNISVGYYSEHTVRENQDIEHLQKLATACLSVEWENLPTERDMTKTEYKEYEPSSSTYGSSYRSAASSGSGYSGGGWRNRDNYNWNCWTGSSNKKSSKKFKDYEDWYDDEDEDNFFDEEEEESYDGYEMKDSRKTYIGDGDSFRQGKVTWNEDGTMNIEIKDDVVYNTITSHYSWVMSKFTGKLTPDELEVISTQYLDINDNDNDLTFYNYLVDYINDDDL